MSTEKLEARIAALEAEVSTLKAQVAAGQPPKVGWRAIVGTIPDDALTRQARKLGRQYRESTRPKAKKGKGKRARPRHRSHEPVAARG